MAHGAPCREPAEAVRTVSGCVGCDASDKGVQGGAEAGLATVGVLLRLNGNAGQATQTDVNSNDGFSSLAARDCRVVFGGRAGTVFTTADAGDARAKRSA